MVERNQDVIGPDGRCQVPNNHSKYRTSCVLAVGSTLVNLQRYDPGPGVQPPDSAACAAIYLHMGGGKERLHCGRGILRLHTRQYHLPNRGLKLGRRRRDGQVNGLDHVNSIRQRCIEPHPDVLRVQARTERDLQVLSLAGRAGLRAALVRDLRMR